MLDINENKKQIYKLLFISIFFLIFGIIYEMFSHNVYSKFMMYAFTIPLLFGFVLYLIIYKTRLNKYLSKFGMTLYNCSLITFTIGTIMKGVLEIYGTTNKLIPFYYIFGIILMIMSIFINIIYNIKKKEGRNI